MKRKIYGNEISPACRYCVHGFPQEDSDWILCLKKGPSQGDTHCRRFRYDPLRRVPRIPPDLPDFSPEEFQL